MDDSNIDDIFQQQRQPSEQAQATRLSSATPVTINDQTNTEDSNPTTLTAEEEAIANALSKDSVNEENANDSENIIRENAELFLRQNQDDDDEGNNEPPSKKQKLDTSSSSNNDKSNNIDDSLQPQEVQELQKSSDDINNSTKSTTINNHQDTPESSHNAIQQAHDQLQQLQQQQKQQSGSPQPQSQPPTQTEKQTQLQLSPPSQQLQQPQPVQRYSSSAIPSDSELFNTNTVHAAYASLSSQYHSSNLESNDAIFSSANLSVLPLPIVAADYLPPRIQLLINTLPTLDNLSTQLLRIVASSSYKRIIDLASNTETAEGATYRDLTSLFEFTKRLYSEEDPFLTVEHLAPGMWHVGEITPQVFKNKEQSIESTLRKVNLATFLAATLGTMEVGFFYLNESFLDIFCPSNDLDVKNHLSDTSYLENSSSALTTSIQTGAGSFIGGKIGKLLKPQALLYLDLKTQAYISAIEAGERSREEILEDILPDDMDQLLMIKRQVNLLLPTENDFIERCKIRKNLLLNYNEENTNLPLNENFKWFNFLKDLFDYVSKNMGYLIWGKSGKPTRDRNSSPSTSVIPKEMYEEINARMKYNQNQNNTTSEDSEDHSKLLPSEIREQAIPVNGHKPSQRRPWTRDEEKAFRHALELKGPHWAAILELFGKDGKINQSLKNRSQIQLKDKARNWKVFYLKNGMEVPHYLKTVTGGLDDRVKRSISRNDKTAAAPVPKAPKQS
ncbi:TBF1 [Candida jiufengensis]|uniref:TBF1 n=1 Tax=Candida jiufengensis TaxID=497108 RepID=UPI0022245FCA|nr:TBF1 [Candida jiufengensis]KAI5951918.1 TBF1 [Candida jiufengensis]